MRKQSQFNWVEYLEYNRQDISIDTFRKWCIKSRPKKSIFDTEQELLQAIIKYDNRERRLSDFKWRQYLKENRPDINIGSLRSWCLNNRQKMAIFDTKQELLETLQLYDNRENKNKQSDFKWRQYLKENRPDINVHSFSVWFDKRRPKKSIFDTEQELLQAISLYDVRVVKSQFKWKQYIEYNRPDINIYNFTTWCIKNRPKKSLFDTEQELIETISRYKLCTKYIVQKTKYQGIYNLIERETGLRFNFYKLEDMEGLL